jgi:hypothetical protein
MLRSVLAVLAGFFAMALLTMPATIIASRVMLGTKSREDMIRMTPTPPYLAVNLTFSALFAALGGYITSWIGQSLLDVYVLAALMFVLGLVSARQNMQQKTSQGRWYGITLVILGPLSALVGGWLQSRSAPHP